MIFAGRLRHDIIHDDGLLPHLIRTQGVEAISGAAPRLRRASSPAVIVTDAAHEPQRKTGYEQGSRSPAPGYDWMVKAAEAAACEHNDGDQGVADKGDEAPTRYRSRLVLDPWTVAPGPGTDLGVVVAVSETSQERGVIAVLFFDPACYHQQ